MNLVEVLLAGMLFSLASAGSLGLMAGLGRSLQQGAAAEAAAQQLDLELRRSEAAVVAAARQGQGTDLACDQPEQLLTSLLAEPAGIGATAQAQSLGTPSAASAATAERPAPPTLLRDVRVQAPGLVRLKLSAAGGRWQRQRLFSAAAYGFCPLAQGVQP